ncbi:TolC family protein [Helicobacter sp. 23-1048]
MRFLIMLGVLVFNLSANVYDYSALEVNTTQSNQNQSNKDSKQNGLTLLELLEGAKNNYNLEAKDIAILQAKASRFAAFAEFLPTLDGNYSYQNADNTYRKTISNAAQLKAEWEVFSGLKTTNKLRSQRSLYRASVADRENTKEQLFLNVIEQYYGYFSNLALKDALEQKKKQLEVNIARVEKLFRAGLTTIDDVESLRAEYLTTEHDLASKLLDIENNKLLLSLLTNLEVENLERVTIKTPTQEVKDRKDIIALGEQAKSALFQARQITYLPTISVSDTFGWNWGLDSTSKPALNDLLGAGGGAFGGSSFMKMSYPPNQNVIGINVSMRIFDFGNIWKQRQAARYTALQREKELAYKKHEQAKDEKLYRKSLEIAQAQIKSSEAALKSATVSFDNVEKKYNAQILNFSDFLQSLTRKFEAEAKYKQSIDNYEIQKARYIYYSGQEIEGYIQ